MSSFALSLVPKAKAARAGKVYGAPGDGYSGHISVITALVLIGAWFLVTEAGWVKPLFLPSPIAVYDKFIVAATDGVANSTLWEHTSASLTRVFGAFFLACLTASADAGIRVASATANGMVPRLAAEDVFHLPD